MRANKNINCIRYALAAVWCAGTLILGGCSEAEGSTWKQEYITCMAVMEQGITECAMAGKQEHEQDTLKQKAWDRVMELWQDSLRAFGECVETCIRNQSGEMDGEEDIYRTATLLMAAMCEEHNGSYEFAYEHGEDTEKIREDFRTVKERDGTDRPVFRIPGLVEYKVVVSLPVAEGILRRRCYGVGLRRLEVV